MTPQSLNPFFLNYSLAQHNGAMAANAEQIDESLKRQALAEEEAAMNQYKKSTNPFLSSPTTASGPSIATAGLFYCDLIKPID